jgi:hypothetical protein
MEITGVDYVVLSNKDQTTVINRFIKLVKEKWKDPIMDGYDEFINNSIDEVDLFFEKDEDMVNEDIGYTINANGEGCFRLLSSVYEKINFDILVNREVVPISRFLPRDPYEVKIIANHIYEYTLILPGRIEDAIFCNEIYSYFIQAFD